MGDNITYRVTTGTVGRDRQMPSLGKQGKSLGTGYLNGKRKKEHLKQKVRQRL